MSAPSQARLEVAIRTEFAPTLRSEGFAGSGRTFRRTREDRVEVVNVQGSKYGDAFTINLGVQPLRIPDVLGNAPDPSKITEEKCEFRRRIGDGDLWWEHDKTEAGMHSAVKMAREVYVQRGPVLFADFAQLLRHATARALASNTLDLAGFGSTKVRFSLALARLRAAEGNAAEAREFAKFGLANIGGATLLRKHLEELAQS